MNVFEGVVCPSRSKINNLHLKVLRKMLLGICCAGEHICGFIVQAVDWVNFIGSPSHQLPTLRPYRETLSFLLISIYFPTFLEILAFIYTYLLTLWQEAGACAPISTPCASYDFNRADAKKSRGISTRSMMVVFLKGRIFAQRPIAISRWYI